MCSLRKKREEDAYRIKRKKWTIFTEITNISVDVDVKVWSNSIYSHLYPRPLQSNEINFSHWKRSTLDAWDFRKQINWRTNRTNQLISIFKVIFRVNRCAYAFFVFCSIDFEFAWRSHYNIIIIIIEHPLGCI